jgi:hypothetical protein
MNIQDALKLFNLSGDITPDLVKSQYKKLAMKYHPDRNPAGLEMMKAINIAFEALKDYSGTSTLDAGDNYPDILNDAINAVINLEGVTIEVCGTWVWLSGDTRTHKDIIKAAGYWWASKKMMWYFRPADYKSSNRGTWDIDDIRSKYGSEKVANKESKKLK